MITGTYYGIVASTKTRVRCVFCGVYIPKANKCIEEHNNGAKHKENMGMVCENGIYYDNIKGLYCKLCQKTLADNESILQHIQSDVHANWLAALDDLIDGEFIRVEAFLASQSNDAYCQPCQVLIPCTLQSIEEHVNLGSHYNNIAQAIKPLNGLFPVDERLEELWCKICDVYVDDNTSAVLEHIETSEDHSYWFMKMDQFVDEDGIFLGDYLSDEYEHTVYCLRCRADILCNLESIEYHVHTEAHVTSNLPGQPQVAIITYKPY